MVAKKVMVTLVVVMLMAAIAAPAMAETRPAVILTGYELVDGQLAPGDRAVIQVDVLNASTESQVDNVLVTYTSDDAAVYPVAGKTNQVYIGEIDAGETVSITLELMVSANAGKVSFLRFMFEYSNEHYADFSNTTVLTLPLTGGTGTFQVQNISIPESATFGNRVHIGVDYVNSGTSSVQNVVMHIKGNISEDQQQVEVGTVAAGESGRLDAYVVPLKMGQNELLVNFTYEDSSGHVQTDQQPFSLNVVAEADGASQGELAQGEENSSTADGLKNEYLIFGLAGVVALLLAVTLMGAIRYFKRR